MIEIIIHVAAFFAGMGLAVFVWAAWTGRIKLKNSVENMDDDE